MITHVKPNHMKLLRELFPQKDGKRIIHTLNWYLTDDVGNLIISNNEFENVMIGEYEFVVRAELFNNQLNVNEMYLQV